MAGNDVQKLYRIGGARWYDSFKRLWNRIASRKAERLLSGFISENITGDTHVLELGCGTGMNLERMVAMGKRPGRYLGLDFSSDMLAAARKKFDGDGSVVFRQADVTSYDGDQEGFDIIISTWMLSHLDDPSRVVNSVRGSLRPNGRIFLIFLSRPDLSLWWFAPIARLIFRSRYVTADDIARMDGIVLQERCALGLTTVIEIMK